MTVCNHDKERNYFLIKQFRNSKLIENDRLCYNCFEFSAFCIVEQIKKLQPEKYKQFKLDAIQAIDEEVSDE